MNSGVVKCFRCSLKTEKMGNSCLNFTCKYIKIEIEMKSCRMQESIREIPAQSMSCFNSFLYSDWLPLANSSFEQ